METLGGVRKEYPEAEASSSVPSQEDMNSIQSLSARTIVFCKTFSGKTFSSKTPSSKTSSGKTSSGKTPATATYHRYGWKPHRRGRCSQFDHTVNGHRPPGRTQWPQAWRMFCRKEQRKAGNHHRSWPGRIKSEKMSNKLVILENIFNFAFEIQQATEPSSA